MYLLRWCWCDRPTHFSKVYKYTLPINCPPQFIVEFYQSNIMLKYVALALLIALAKADKLPGTFFPNSDFDPGFKIVTNVEARDGSIDTYDAPQAPVISQQCRFSAWARGQE